MHRYIDFPGMPPVPGLRFRHYGGQEDLPGMTSVIERSMAADGEDHVTSLEDMQRAYAHLDNCDPAEDIIIAEVDGRIEGYGRHSWVEEKGGFRRYELFANLVPELRPPGVREAMYDWLESHISQQTKAHPPGEKAYEVWAGEDEVHLNSLLKGRGYAAVRIGASMVRPNLDDIPDLPLPKGVEVRPALPEHYRLIYDTHVDAFRESWGFAERDFDKDYSGFSSGRFFQPHLWQVAWHGDEVVGQVKPFILPDENEKYNRKRGYTEFISTKKAWRGKGIASALIARALKRIKEEGMTEAALGVDTENVHNAMQLYERMGFRKDKIGWCYRKPVP